MSSLFAIFKPPAHIDRIQDPDEVDQNYKYWRLRIFYSMFFGYAFYYLTRKSFTFAMPALIQDLGFDKGQLGFLASVFAVAYGLSKFASGILADRSNPRYFMAVGLILTGVFNIFFGLSSSLTMFALFWGLNGWFQGYGWPPCARLLTHWYSQSERGTWWGAWNVSHNVGGAIITVLAAVIAEWYGWRFAMFVPAVLCIIAGFFLINRLRDTPQSLGLPPIEQYRKETGGKSEEETEKELSAKEILLKHVICNPYIWLLGFAYCFIYIIRTGFNDWSMLYFVEEKHYSNVRSGSVVFWFEIGGFFGSLFAGWSSDYLFKGRRGPVNVIFAFGLIVVVGLFCFLPNFSYFFDSVALFAIGFLVFGPQMLIGMAAAELAQKKSAATASGFVGWFAYMGAAVAGFPLGKITQVYGWEGFFWMMVVCSIIAALLLVPFWFLPAQSHVRKPKKPKLQPVTVNVASS